MCFGHAATAGSSMSIIVAPAAPRPPRLGRAFVGPTPAASISPIAVRVTSSNTLPSSGSLISPRSWRWSARRNSCASGPSPILGYAPITVVFISHRHLYFRPREQPGRLHDAPDRLRPFDRVQMHTAHAGKRPQGLHHLDRHRDAFGFGVGRPLHPVD